VFLQQVFITGFQDHYMIYFHVDTKANGGEV